MVSSIRFGIDTDVVFGISVPDSTASSTEIPNFIRYSQLCREVKPALSQGSFSTVPAHAASEAAATMSAGCIHRGLAEKRVLRPVASTG